MRALVIYYSFFGNTEKVARAIGETIDGRADVEVIRVGNVKMGQADCGGLITRRPGTLGIF